MRLIRSRIVKGASRHCLLLTLFVLIFGSTLSAHPELPVLLTASLPEEVFPLVVAAEVSI